MKRRQVVGGLVALTGVVIAVIAIIFADSVRTENVVVIKEPLDPLYAGPPRLRPPQNSIPTTVPNR